MTGGPQPVGASDGLHLLSFPAGVSVDLFTATGAVLSAALRDCGELMLAAADSPGIAARLVLETELAQTQVAAALRAAAEQIAPEAAARAAQEAEPAADDGLEVGHMHAHDDGSVSFGMGGDLARDCVRDLAAQLASTMLPAMESMGAGNYLAWKFVDVKHGGEWELTITKPRGLTPRQARDRCQAALREIAAGGRQQTKATLLATAQAALDAVKAPAEASDA